MRNIITVVEEIKQNVPVEEEHLLHALSSLLDSIRYTPPEGMYLRWRQLNEYLQVVYPLTLEKKWQIKVISIFSTVAEETIEGDLKNQEVAKGLI